MRWHPPSRGVKWKDVRDLGHDEAIVLLYFYLRHTITNCSGSRKMTLHFSDHDKAFKKTKYTAMLPSFPYENAEKRCCCCCKNVVAAVVGAFYWSTWHHVTSRASIHWLAPPCIMHLISVLERKKCLQLILQNSFINSECRHVSWIKRIWRCPFEKKLWIFCLVEFLFLLIVNVIKWQNTID